MKSTYAKSLTINNSLTRTPSPKENCYLKSGVLDESASVAWEEATRCRASLSAGTGGSEWVSDAGFLGRVSRRGHQWTEGPSPGTGLVEDSSKSALPTP